MFAQDIQLVAENLQIIGLDVATISPLGDELQCHLFTTTCEPQWLMWPLHPFGFVDGLIDGIVFPAERRVVFRPHAMNNLSCLEEACYTFASVWIAVTIGPILVFVPSCSKAQDKVSVTHHIQRRT